MGGETKSAMMNERVLLEIGDVSNCYVVFA